MENPKPLNMFGIEKKRPSLETFPNRVIAIRLCHADELSANDRQVCGGGQSLVAEMPVLSRRSGYTGVPGQYPRMDSLRGRPRPCITLITLITLMREIHEFEYAGNIYRFNNV